MAHLAAGAGIPLAVEMQMRARLCQDFPPTKCGVADKVFHLDSAATGGRSKRQAADGADMLVELRGLGAFAGPVSGIVHPRRDLVDDDGLARALANHEHLDGEDTDIA